ncbi:hypothetical protein SAMN06265375_10344 [Muriicola jejuensis]|nr:hypothetical protein SAMN06265375_10344 [Muriicola jejuensis]
MIMQVIKNINKNLWNLSSIFAPEMKHREESRAEYKKKLPCRNQ